MVVTGIAQSSSRCFVKGEMSCKPAGDGTQLLNHEDGGVAGFSPLWVDDFHRVNTSIGGQKSLKGQLSPKGSFNLLSLLIPLIGHRAEAGGDDAEG